MIKTILDIAVRMFSFLLIVSIFSFALCSSVLNVYAIQDTEPTAGIKVAERASKLILEVFTEDVTEKPTEDFIEEVTDASTEVDPTEPTEAPTEEYTKIENQPLFNSVLLVMLFVVFVATLFIRYV